MSGAASGGVQAEATMEEAMPSPMEYRPPGS